MAIIGKSTPEEILGMPQDEFKKKLDSAATKEDIAAIAQKNAEQATTLAEIRQALSALTTKPPADQPPPDKTSDEPDNDTVSMLADPKGMIRKETQDIRNSSLQTQADLREMRARQNPAYAHLFEQYDKEISEIAAKYSLEQRATANFWDFHLRTFIGDQMIQGKVKPEAYPTLIGSSSVAPSATGDKRDPDHGFHRDQVAFFKDHNIPVDSAAVIERVMRRDGNPLTLETYRAAKAELSAK